MNILFCINHDYISQFKHCLYSLLRFKDNYHIYIFHTDLTKEDEMYITHTFKTKAQFSFIYINQELLQDFPTTKRYPLEIYYRILASKYLPDTLDRILYLDADIIVLRSLTSLYETKMDEEYYIACSHVRRGLTFINNRRLGSKHMYPYINTGVLLMNLTKLRKHQSKQEIIDFVEHYRHRLWLPDQDIISILYGAHIKTLDTMIYNLSDRLLWLYNIRHPFHQRSTEWVKQNVYVIHYCGKNKPWKKHYYGKLDVFYKEIIQEEGD